MSVIATPINDARTNTAVQARLPPGRLAAYAVAQIGSSLFFHVPLIILLPFMTSLLGVAPAVGGLVIFVPKIWVMVCDPLAGLLSDRVRRPDLRRRIFVVIGGAGTAAGFALLFSMPPLGDWTALGVGLLYLVGSTFYSAFSVPYLAMATEVAPTRSALTTLTSSRMAANFIGALLAGLAPLMVQKLGAGRIGYHRMGEALGAVCLVSVVVFFLGTRGATAATTSARKTPLRASLAVVGDRSFRVLLRTYALQLLGVGVVQSAFAYYVIYQLGGDLSSLTHAVLALTLGSLASQPLWVALARRVGKLSAYRIATVLMILAEGSYLLLGRGQLGGLLAVSAAVGVGAGGYPLMAWSLLYELIEADHARHGVERAGAYTGLWSATEKVTLAAGVFMTGLLLQLFGFHGGLTGFGRQPASALLAARLLPGLGPSLLLAISLISLRGFQPPRLGDAVVVDEP